MIEFTEGDRNRLREIADCLDQTPYPRDMFHANFLRKLAERPAGDAEGWYRTPSDKEAEAAAEALSESLRRPFDFLLPIARDALVAAALADQTPNQSAGDAGLRKALMDDEFIEALARELHERRDEAKGMPKLRVRWVERPSNACAADRIQLRKAILAAMADSTEGQS